MTCKICKEHVAQLAERGRCAECFIAEVEDEIEEEEEDGIQKMPPEKGIKKMETRIRGLRLMLQMAIDNADGADYMLDASDIHRHLKTAEERLAEYQAQKEGRN